MLHSKMTSVYYSIVQ